MKLLLALAFTFSVATSRSAAAAVAADVNGVTDVRVSANGAAVAVINETDGGPAVNVFRAGTRPELLFTVGKRQFADFSTDVHVDAIAWSPDGQLLTIEVDDGDEERALFVVEPARGLRSCRLLKIGTHNVAWGSWAATGHVLCVTLADAGGIHELDPLTLRVRTLVADVAVAVALAVSADTIVAKIEHRGTPGRGAELVSVNIRTGKLTRLTR